MDQTVTPQMDMKSCSQEVSVSARSFDLLKEILMAF